VNIAQIFSLQAGSFICTWNKLP